MQNNDIPHFDRKLGRKIREARQMCGITQTELGKKIGVSYQQIQKNESGRSRISAERLHMLGKILKMPMTYFLDVNDAARSQWFFPAETLRLARSINDLPSDIIRKNIKSLVFAINATWQTKTET